MSTKTAARINTDVNVACAINTSTSDGVHIFLAYVDRELIGGWHPDTPAGDMVTVDMRPVFTQAQADALDAKWSEVFASCDALGLDIYECALDAYGAQ